MNYLDALKIIAERMRSKEEDLLWAFAEDIGVSVKVGRTELKMSADYLATMEEELPYVGGRKPYGAVGAILPYDASTVMFARIVGSAIVGGNSVRISFSSLTPSVRDLMVEVVRDFEDIITINTEHDNRTFGEICCTDEKVRLFYISGAGAVGELFKRRLRYLDKLIFAGPSGMPPALVMPGANVERAATFIARRAFLNGGQYCTTIKRAIVHSSYRDDFMHTLLKVVDDIKIGDPLDENTDYGPVKAKRTRLLVERALRLIKGDYIRGGTIEGEWIPPIVVMAGEPPPDIELFGPFLAVRFVEDPEDMVREAISTSYGHIIYIFGDLREDQKRKIEENFGMVHYEPEFLFLPLRAPYGGKKESGWVLERIDNRVVKRDGPIIYSYEMTRP